MTTTDLPTLHRVLVDGKERVAVADGDGGWAYLDAQGVYLGGGRHVTDLGPIPLVELPDVGQAVRQDDGTLLFPDGMRFDSATPAQRRYNRDRLLDEAAYEHALAAQKAHEAAPITARERLETAMQAAENENDVTRVTVDLDDLRAALGKS